MLFRNIEKKDTTESKEIGTGFKKERGGKVVISTLKI
jgi:hypothetical protein